MKHTQNLRIQPNRYGLVLALAAVLLSSFVVRATPYASGITNDNGTIRFIMNEAGATVTVVYTDDGTTNTSFDGVSTGLNQAKGPASFDLLGHNSYKITCYKSGNGTPFLISSDTYSNSMWANPRGVAVNPNPKVGYLFGHIYAGSSGPGGYSTPGHPGFKGNGLYGFNADQTDGTGLGTNAAGTSAFLGNPGPWKISVAPDNSVIVNDFSTPGAALYAFAPDLRSSNLVLAIVGQTAAALAGIHGDMNGGGIITGSAADNTLTVWTADGGMGVPPGTVLGPGTRTASYNCVYRYNVGGAIPAGGWNHIPDWGYTMGLDGIPELKDSVAIGKDGKIWAGFGRGNMSNPDVQILDPTGSTILYTSWDSTGALTDPFNGSLGGGAVGLNGCKVSPSGNYFASTDANSGITVVSIKNGLPDDGTIFSVPNSPYTASSRGIDWDAADNIYLASSGQFLLRIYSLGGTTTCISSNDATGLNGSFILAPPPIVATLEATQPYASQNYVNNALVSPPLPVGVPIAGTVHLAISTNFLASPLTVSFTRTGTAVYNAVNAALSLYTINTGTTGSGIIIGTNSVTFPAGTAPGGNWQVDITITPTAYPVSTNTTTLTMQIANPTAYVPGNPAKGIVYIQNTGPQKLYLTASPTTLTSGTGNTMYRGVTNDYCRFVITRYGDTNGPGNYPGSVAANAYTITNLNYYGTAVYPTDYRARAQRADPYQDNKIYPPVDGPTAIYVYPGDSAVTCLIGGPVAHTDFFAARADRTVIFNLTNRVAAPSNTNGIPTPEGYTYNVDLGQQTCTILDNAVGPEPVLLYSNPLTNAADSVNWTLVYDSVNLPLSATGPGLPAVIPNYVNDQSSILAGGTNDFNVKFGWNLADESGIGFGASPNVDPSPVMLASNWTQVLRMSVNKQNIGQQCAVNLFPQGMKFGGNYALRCNMYLSLWLDARNNSSVSSKGRENALFGINNYGTNCDWKADAPVLAGQNSWTNHDGQWFSVDAGYGGITPADFDAFVAAPVPNPASIPDKVSNSANPLNGVFKHPPFDASNVTDYSRRISAPGGGQAVDKWVDVSIEVTEQTNVNFYINRSTVVGNFPLTNGTGMTASYTNGTIMLGYQDPNADISGLSSFVYYSNLRVVELSPAFARQPMPALGGLTVTQGQAFSLTNTLQAATAPLTNRWFAGTTTGTTGSAILTNTVLTGTVGNTSMTNILTVTPLVGTNYWAVATDPAGSVTSLPTIVEVITSPSNNIATVGATVPLTIRASGNGAPTAYQWRTNTTALVASAKYGGVTSTNMFITNVQPSDAGTYSVLVTAPYGNVTPAGTLTVVSPITPASSNALWGSSPKFTVPSAGLTPTVYQWYKNGLPLAGASSSVLTFPGVTKTNVGTYTVGVTNAAGKGVFVASGILTVSVPPPQFANTVGVPPVTVDGVNVVLAFDSPNNIYDTTNAFILLESPDVALTNTLWTTNTSAVWTTNGAIPPQFRVTVPQTSTSNMFYHLQHVVP